MRTVPRALPGLLAAALLLGGCAVPPIPVNYPSPTSTPTDKAVAEACSALGDAVSKAGSDAEHGPPADEHRPQAGTGDRTAAGR